VEREALVAMHIVSEIQDFKPIGSGVTRSTGVHLTDILKRIEAKLGLGYTGTGFRDRWLTMDIGFVWEQVLSRAYGDRAATRPGEIVLDGVACSPDGIGTDDEVIAGVPGDGGLVLEEYKCTWRSSRRDIADNWIWMAQTKAYLKAVSEDLGVPLRTVLFRVLYLMGCYDGSGPAYMVARIRFDQEEIDRMWEMVLEEKALMERG